MKLLGNILWFLCGGIIGGLAWIIAGCIWCVTIVGIPVGLQCFKFASLAFWPFGKEVVYGNGTFSFLVNLIWILFFGWGMALGNIVLGCRSSDTSERNKPAGKRTKYTGKSDVIRSGKTFTEQRSPS